MEITLEYIFSQIFTVIGYFFTTATYHASNRKLVLILNLLSKFSFMVAYILLGAWSALAMIGVALIRNIVFMINKKDTIKDILMLIIVYLTTIISAIYTYEGFYSLLPVFATLIYTYSIFQKNIRIYKFLGIPTETCCVIYNFYIKSISAIILGIIPLISSIVGFLREINKKEVNQFANEKQLP